MSIIYPIGPEEPITSLIVAKYHDELIEPIKLVLEMHGGLLCINSYTDNFGAKLADRYTITFPDGTLKQNIYPMTYSNRYTITFPDGYVVYGQDAVRPDSPALVTFNFNEEFPLWVQEKYKKK